MLRIAQEKIKIMDAEKGHADVLNGAALFAYHMLSVIMTIEQKAQRMMVQTLDLKQRDTARSLLANMQNLAGYVATMTANPAALESALMEAAGFASELHKQATARSADAAPATTDSPIILTDTK